MTLTLRIDNFNHLPDGGPIEYSVNGQGFEFGRDAGMDWTLPDPNRFVSSCHGEVRFENDGYVLVDVSTNGTFVNGASARVKSPYQLQDGDRLQVGHYLVLVSTGAAAAAAPDPFSSPAPAPSGGGGGDIWSMGSGAPASSAGDFDPTPRGERLPDYGDQHIDLPDFGGGTPPPPGGAGSFETPAAPTGDDGGSPFGDPAPAPAEQPSPEDAGSPFDPPAAAEPPATPPPSAEESASPFEPPAPAPEPQPAPAAAPAAPAPAPAAPPPTAAPAAPPPTVAPAAPPPAAPEPAAPPAQPPTAAPPIAPTPQSEAFPAPPAPTPAAPLPSAPPPKTGETTDASAFLHALCAGAGMPQEALDGADAGAVAHEIGKALRISVTELVGLLRARAAANKWSRQAAAPCWAATKTTR